DGAGDAIFVCDAATNMVVEANAQALTDTAYAAEEIKGLSMDRLFQSQNGSSADAVSWNVDDVCKSGHDGLQLVKKNGEVASVNVSVTSVKWSEANYLFVAARKTRAALFSVDSAAANRTAWSEQEDFPSIIGQSGKIHNVCRLIGSVAKSEATVLIRGESGTGKEIVANVIHAHSHRCRGPFVKVNCAALTETLLESELFGHLKGAFTGAIRDHRGRFKQADGGTILLDEVGSMPLSGQAKLLRVLQEHEFEPVGSSVTTSVNVRVIAATNVDLEKAVSDGKFREDLYYRLKVFEISVPPLRERKEDIPLLSQHFLNQCTQSVRKQIRALAPETLALLIEHDWPGNVRELENAVEHAVIVEKSQVVLPSSLPMNLTKSCDGEATPEHSTEMGLREQLNLLEKQILLDTLLRAQGIKKQAAAMLGIDPRNMPYLLRKHRLVRHPL
ncbi:MAG TPA: sigma 54-interacting transcriptional regulator, partial [Terriglobia bacterium]|nr:sigma 54-interacting transcriptional regulator [Terriglobia bacterium]